MHLRKPHKQSRGRTDRNDLIRQVAGESPRHFLIFNEKRAANRIFPV